VGDTPIFITSDDEVYEEIFIEALKKLYSRNIQKIFPGHGKFIAEECKTLLYESLRSIRNAKSSTE